MRVAAYWVGEGSPAFARQKDGSLGPSIQAPTYSAARSNARAVLILRSWPERGALTTMIPNKTMFARRGDHVSDTSQP